MACRFDCWSSGIAKRQVRTCSAWKPLVFLSCWEIEIKRSEDLDELSRDPSTLNVKDENILASLREQLNLILKHSSKELITIFSMDSSSSSGGGDIEMAILKAFLNCKPTT